MNRTENSLLLLNYDDFDVKILKDIISAGCLREQYTVIIKKKIMTSLSKTSFYYIENDQQFLIYSS